MTPEERDRLTILEVAGKERGDDIKEIKELLLKMDSRLTTLEKVAATGGGALKTALMLGGVIGWVVGPILALIALFKH